MRGDLGDMEEHNGVISSQWPGMRPHETLAMSPSDRSMCPVSALMMITQGPLPVPGVTSHLWHHKMLQLSIRDQARTSCGVSEAGEAISQSYQSLNQLMRATPGRGRVRGHRTNCDIACGLHLNQVWEINHMSSFITMVLFIINPINTVLGTPPSVRAGVREWTCVVWVEDKWFIDTKIGLKKYFCICD